MSWNQYSTYAPAPHGLEDDDIPLYSPVHDPDQDSHETIDAPPEEHPGMHLSELYSLCCHLTIPHYDTATFITGL